MLGLKIFVFKKINGERDSKIGGVNKAQCHSNYCALYNRVIKRLKVFCCTARKVPNIQDFKPSRITFATNYR